MSRAAVPGVVALLCPACHNHLPAASNDIAFRCPRCGRGWEIERHRLVARDARHLVPPSQAERPGLYLPYWSFAARVEAVASGSAPETVLARRRAGELDRVLVAACTVHRPSYVGDWALIYTRTRPEWQVREGGGPAAPGASIGSSEAATIGRYYVLAEIDRVCDLGLLEVNVELGAPELWAIPCLDLGDRLRCPWTRLEIPAVAVDDLSEIRGATERAGA